MRTLVLLQNAWANTPAGAKWLEADRGNWLWATAQSRSGKRLEVLLGSECWSDEDIWFDNTTPKCGVGSSSKLKPDPTHVRGVLESFSPSVVIACGGQAAIIAGELWQGDLLCIPHPAHRLLTNELYRHARGLWKIGAVGRVELRQGRGVIETKELSVTV